MYTVKGITFFTKTEDWFCCFYSTKPVLFTKMEKEFCIIVTLDVTVSTLKCLQISKVQQNYCSAQKFSFVAHSTKKISKS